jgi:hypothetical protein
VHNAPQMTPMHSPIANHLLHEHSLAVLQALLYASPDTTNHRSDHR